MSKIQNLQKALNQSLGKAPTPQPVKANLSKENPALASAKPGPEQRAIKTSNSSREGKEHVGAWLNPDFKSSLQLVQIRKRKGGTGKKVFLDDLIAEALNDLFRKYDVPTVHHE